MSSLASRANCAVYRFGMQLLSVLLLVVLALSVVEVDAVVGTKAATMVSQRQKLRTAVTLGPDAWVTKMEEIAAAGTPAQKKVLKTRLEDELETYLKAHGTCPPDVENVNEASVNKVITAAKRAFTFEGSAAIFQEFDGYYSDKKFQKVECENLRKSALGTRNVLPELDQGIAPDTTPLEDEDLNSLDDEEAFLEVSESGKLVRNGLWQREQAAGGIKARTAARVAVGVDPFEVLLAWTVDLLLYLEDTVTLPVKDQTFLTCAFGKNRGGTRRTKRECYKECYRPFVATAYDADTYKAKGKAALVKHKGTYTYKDWKPNPSVINADAGLSNANLQKAYISATKNGFNKNVDSANSIRVTLQIKGDLTGAARAEALWAVVDHMIQNTSPDWLKVDTPGHERLDSILLRYQLATIVDKRTKFHDVCERAKAHFAASLGTDLPAFQYKGTCEYASVADYFKGKSFGENLCSHVSKRSSSATFISKWTEHGHPFSDHWWFEDPTC